MDKCPHCGKLPQMFECLDCGADVDELFMDYRTPPLDDEECLCKMCYESMIDEEIERHKDDIKFLQEVLVNPE